MKPLMELPDSTATVRAYRFQQGHWEALETNVIREAAVTLSVNGVAWLTWMCTPVDLEALAIGFLFNEGLIQSVDEIASYDVCARGTNVDVWAYRALPRPMYWKRTSGCSGGVTAAPTAVCQPETAPQTIAPAQISALMRLLMEAQELYRSARGVHTSALSDGEKLVVVAEDIGRHNSLDKIAGHVMIDRLDLPNRILLTTGRISSEMLQKAARIGASILISHSAANALSIRMAWETGVTLIGYVRGEQFLAYTHPERIDGAPIEAVIPKIAFSRH